MINKFQILLDCNNEYSFLYLIKNKKEIVTFNQYLNNKDLSYKLVEYVKLLLKNNNLTINNINGIYLIYGPGKFSAMRICANFIKTVNLLKNIDIYIMDKFDYLSQKNSICIIKSEGNKSFVCTYDQNNSKEDDIRLIENKYINNLYNSKTNIISDQDNYYYDFNKIINKLTDFKQVNYEFLLHYFKPPC